MSRATEHFVMTILQYDIVLFLCFVSFCPQLVIGQFPAVCVQNATQPDAVCCPLWEGNGLPCGGPARGHCVKLANRTADYQPKSPLYPYDDRFAWPLKFFQHACECKGNYYGYKCHECKFGYRGQGCSYRKVNKRQNILTLPKRRVEQIKATLNKMKATKSDFVVMNTTRFDKNYPSFIEVNVYDFYVFVHYFATIPNFIDVLGTCFSYKNSDFGHQGSGFLTWHRYFLLRIEREMQRLSGDDDLALPYWDWAGKAECEVCTNKYFGATLNSKGYLHPHAAFAHWKTLCENIPLFSCQLCDIHKKGKGLVRRPGTSRNYPILPSLETVRYALSLTEYDMKPFSRNSPKNSFRQVMEGFADQYGVYPDVIDGGRYTMHNKVHGWLNGTMSVVPTSFNDPIFLLHHNFLDKLLEIWIRRNNPNPGQLPSHGAPMGNNREENMAPFFPPAQHVEIFKDSRQLGYDFDLLNQFDDENMDNQLAQDPGVSTSPKASSSPVIWVVAMVTILVVSVVLIAMKIWSGISSGRRQVFPISKQYGSL